MRDFWKLMSVYLAPYKGKAALNILFNILGVIFSLLSLVLIGPFLQILFGTQEIVSQAIPWEWSRSAIEHNFNFLISRYILESGSQKALLIVSLLVVLLFFLKTSNIYLANHFLAPIRNGVVRDIRNKIYQKILILPIGFFSDEKKGDIISRVTQDVQDIEWSIMASLEKFFRDPINIIIFLIGLFLIHPILTVFVLVLLPVSALLIGTIGKNLRKTSAKGQDQMGQLMSFIEETLSGLRIVKAFNAETHMRAGFSRKNEDLTHTMNRITRRRYLASPLSEFLGAMVIVVLLIYGGNLVLSENSSLNAASFIAYIAVFSQLLTPAKSFSTAFYHVQKGMASFDRVNRILLTENNIHDDPQAIDIVSFSSNIEFQNVSFSYRDKEVLRDISFDLKKGRTIALVGSSGSGKSTFVDLLPRFHDVNSGSILLDGKNIRKISLKTLRHLFGYVHQEALLFNDSFLNNIAFGTSKPDRERVIRAARAANAEAFILENKSGYDTNIGDLGGKLSGGQRQRISIARAIYADPQILILDEATSALDSETERIVYEALKEIMKDRTTIIVAHRLSTIQSADQILVFKEGEIIEQGIHEDLLAMKGEYYRLYQEKND